MRRNARFEPIVARSANNNKNSDKAAPFSFTVDVKVRDSELDQFNVVNNANYAVYLQHARHEFLERLGLPVAAATAEGGALALSRLDLRFRAPLRSGDVARCGVRVTEARGARVVMSQWVDAIRKKERGREKEEQDEDEEEEEESVDIVLRSLDAEATVVALDGRYRPVRLPRAVVSALETGVRVPRGTRWFSSSSSSEEEEARSGASGSVSTSSFGSSRDSDE